MHSAMPFINHCLFPVAPGMATNIDITCCFSKVSTLVFGLDTEARTHTQTLTMAFRL